MTRPASKYAAAGRTLPTMMLHLSAAIVAVHLVAAPGISPRTVRTAQREAATILRSAHEKLIWTSGPALDLEIVDDDLHGVPADAVGLASLSREGSYARISWPGVCRAAGELNTDRATVLAAAIAHELGHILFGPSHSAEGIMSAHFGHKEMVLAGRSELLFTGIAGH